MLLSSESDPVNGGGREWFLLLPIEQSGNSLSRKAWTYREKCFPSEPKKVSPVTVGSSKKKKGTDTFITDLTLILWHHEDVHFPIHNSCAYWLFHTHTHTWNVASSVKTVCRGGSSPFQCGKAFLEQTAFFNHDHCVLHFGPPEAC
jgi:hypothetical protein